MSMVVLASQSMISQNGIWNLRIGNEEIEEKVSFNYLGSLVTSDAKCKKDIRKRISIAKEKFQDMRSIFTNYILSMKLKIRLLKCYV